MEDTGRVDDEGRAVLDSEACTESCRVLYCSWKGVAEDNCDIVEVCLFLSLHSYGRLINTDTHLQDGSSQ